jgi:hypothetical protein
MDIDDELKLLSGGSFFVDGIEIKPFILKDIIALGYMKYQQMLNIFVLSIGDIIQGEISDEFKDINVFDLLINSGEKELLEGLLNSIEKLLNVEITYVDKNTILLDDKKIDRDNWDEICKIIKLQNCFKTDEEKDGENPADARTAELLRKRAEARKLLEKAKKNDSDGEPLTFADLVSILSANGNNINLLNVWDLNFYQFNNQFNRMKMLEDYDISIRSLLAGAKAEDVDLKHWMSKIK